MTEAKGDDIASLALAQSKLCRTCGVEKDTSQFYAAPSCRGSVKPDCIQCYNNQRRERYKDPDARRRRKSEYSKNADKYRAQSRKWRANNIERAQENGRRWRENNPGEQAKASRAWRTNNLGRVNDYSKNYYRNNRQEILKKRQEWRDLNREYVRDRDRAYQAENPEIRKKIDKKRRGTPKGRLEHAISTNVRRGLLNGGKNGRRSFDLLGYSIDDLRKHLEKQFTTGMSWENYGEWHVDHIVPLSAHNYDTPEHIDFQRAWALENLRPLWAGDNYRKNDKLDEPFQPSFAL